MDNKSAATVDAPFRQVRDEQDATVRADADYRYAATPGQGGELNFKRSHDWYKPGSTTSQLEILTIKSRWQESGAGRSDVRLSGGDLVGEATINECWNTDFARRFPRASHDPRVGHGTEATDCVFTPAAYSTL
jgi:hypothetical protein